MKICRGFLYYERLSFSEIREIQEESGIIPTFSIYIKPIDIIRIKCYSNPKMKKLSGRSIEIDFQKTEKENRYGQ